MRVAYQNCKHGNQITLVTTQFEEDKKIIPNYFKILPNLKRSVIDVKIFNKKRKLPLINDILQQAYKYSDSEYVIYTNTDIVLMPFFYDMVFEYIAAGYDAFAINRRRISKQFFNSENLNAVYAEVGKSHPGFDCFVFKRSFIPKMVFADICVGVPFLEASLLYNLIAFSENFRLFYNKHLTVHIGMEVMPKRNAEYYWHNRNEFFKKVLPILKPKLKANNLPYSELPFFRRMLNYMLNPSVFTLINTELEAKNLIDKLLLLKDEIRFSILQKD
jgi:hypothetical protein